MIKYQMYSIRKANLDDLEQISELERICFPASEAATKDILKKRLEKFSNYFYVLLVSEKIVSMVNGMITDTPDLIDNARNENRKGLVLTCKKNLICYYEKFGFVSEGRSNSMHGDAIWYQMRLKF